MTDETAALDFDLACSYRLQLYDNERELDRFKALSAMLGGNPDGGDIQDDEDTIIVW